VADVDDLHHCESDAERLEYFDSCLEDNKYLYPMVELVEGSVRSPNPMQRVSQGANEWPASTFLSGRSNPRV
jgi:hypothetical protein